MQKMQASSYVKGQREAEHVPDRKVKFDIFLGFSVSNLVMSNDLQIRNQRGCTHHLSCPLKSSSIAVRRSPPSINSVIIIGTCGQG